MNEDRSEFFNLADGDSSSCSKKQLAARKPQRKPAINNVRTLNSQGLKKGSELIKGDIENNPNIQGQSIGGCQCSHCIVQRRKIKRNSEKTNDLPFSCYSKPVSFLFRKKPTNNEFESP